MPTYVLGSDGLLYCDPVLRGAFESANWFLCFDCEEPPELVISLNDRCVSEGDILQDARMLLKENSIKANVISGPFRSVRCFGPDAGIGPYLQAGSVFLELRGAIPASLLRCYHGTHQPRGECQVYSMGQAWG